MPPCPESAPVAPSAAAIALMRIFDVSGPALVVARAHRLHEAVPGGERLRERSGHSAEAVQHAAAIRLFRECVGSARLIVDREARHVVHRVVEDDSARAHRVGQLHHLGELGHQRHLNVSVRREVEVDRPQVHDRARILRRAHAVGGQVRIQLAHVDLPF